MLDLNGDGIHTRNVWQGVLFDLDGSGQATPTGWSDGKDGLLALDLNHDGRINSGAELFGSATHTPTGKAQDGYQALRQHDTNADGVIDAQDAVFKDLQVWVDRNVDGVTNPGELHSLQELGIASLNLNAQSSTATDQGNTLGLVSSWSDVLGQTHDMADVWFLTQSLADLVKRATGTQNVDVSNNNVADVVDVHVADVRASAHKLVVVRADANDTVRIDQTGWSRTSTATVVDNHTYELWSNSAGAHLLIDQQAKVQAVL